MTTPIRYSFQDTKQVYCIDKIEGSEFTLEDMYRFESDLKNIFVKNNHIKEKIRQQLQILRDKEIIEFKGRGKYRKL